MTEWEPTSDDLNWTKRTLEMLKTDGLWATSYALYKKTGDNEITLVDIRPTAPNIKRNVRRTEKAIRRCGYDYFVREPVQQRFDLIPEEETEMRRQWKELADSDGKLFGMTYDEFTKITRNAIEDLMEKDETFRAFVQGINMRRPKK